MADIFNLSDTWNDGATTFSAIKMDVTDTASASGSLLMDLQVGGVSRFAVDKAGFAQVSAAGLPSNGNITFNSNNTIIFRHLGSTQTAGVTSSGLQVAFNRAFGWSTNLNTGAGNDLELLRDAADTLAQRRSTNPQAFRAYNTYTDASNYERGKIAWESNVLKIGTEKAGTGSARALELQTDGVTRLTIATDGVCTIPNRIETGNDLQAGVNRAVFFGSSGTGHGRIQNSADAVFGLYGRSSTEPRLQFGGTTSSFPALKRSTTALQVRLADDSAFTNIQGKITTETAYTAGAPTATGYIVLYDSTGTAYKVPAEAL